MKEVRNYYYKRAHSSRGRFEINTTRRAHNYNYYQSTSELINKKRLNTKYLNT